MHLFNLFRGTNTLPSTPFMNEHVPLDLSKLKRLSKTELGCYFSFLSLPSTHQKYLLTWCTLSVEQTKSEARLR